MTSVLLILALAMVTIAVALGPAHQNDDRSIKPPYLIWIEGHIIEIIFTMPALIAAFRGRRYLKSIMLGKLSPFTMIGVGVAVGCTCVLFSSTIRAFSNPPTFHMHGFFAALGVSPLTAYLLGPFGEEMLYQVGLQTWLQRFGPIAAVFGATAPFWGIHLYGGFVPIQVALTYILPGILAYAIMRQTTQSFGAAVLAHSTYNVLVSCLY